MINQDPSANIVLPKLPKEILGLSEIALNLWWTWNPEGMDIFHKLNPYLWKECGHNPIEMLTKIEQTELETVTKDIHFMRAYNYVYALFQSYIKDSNIYADEEPLPIAYFCAEYGLHHSLPIYSGGLGFLAGDILKESSDMGLPMVGIGFMYPQGYIRQVIGSDGWQNGTNETIDKDTAPIERVLDENDAHFTIQVPFIDPPVYASVWKVNVGRVTLYLLDTDIDKNDPWDREISSRLYNPDMNQRLRQQIVLGIGGYRVLEELGIKYSILHLNEGHPAFALFERIRSYIEVENIPLQEAIERVSKTSVFTTHTPLQAATDVYTFEMMSQYFGDYWKRLGMEKEQFLSFGINPDQPNAGFNMTVFGLNMCQNRNAVSKKHGEVTKGIWKNLFPIEHTADIPIHSITNGVHVPTWMNADLRAKIDAVLGSNWLNAQDDMAIWSKVAEMDDREIWDLHYKHKVALINFIRERVRRKWSVEHTDSMVAMAEGVMLDPDVLTIGFARRMTSYKRPDLILHDLNRLEKIVNNYEKPVQIIFAGKAHPSDNPGKSILQHIFKTAQDVRFGGRIAFVEDYGEEVAKYLVRGVDVWLNNPLIPMEASGTSGIKASLNGTLHLSVMDGWWPEAYANHNGWTFGHEPSDDAADSQDLYNVIEQKIVPLFYRLGEDTLPHAWIAMMKKAMMSITPSFSARRMMKEYLDKFYIPISKELQKEDIDK